MTVPGGCETFFQEIDGDRTVPLWRKTEKQGKQQEKKKKSPAEVFKSQSRVEEKFAQLSWKFITSHEHVDIKNDMFQQENEL